jgi:ATP/ADP translocase
LWEEGRRPGRQVVTLSTIGTLSVAGVNLLLTEELSLFFDLSFVVLCLVAALAVRPRDFFVVGVLPPLLMVATITLLAVFARSAVAEEVDSLVQAVVSGLAHHAGALVAGYALALVILALRQVALRNSGRLRTFA